MRVLLAGATGVIGRQLTPLLAANGHEVFGLIRPDRGPGRVADLGGTAIVGDLLDADQVMQAVARVEPEAVVHMATAIPARPRPAPLRGAVRRHQPTAPRGHPAPARTLPRSTAYDG